MSVHSENEKTSVIARRGAGANWIARMMKRKEERCNDD